MVDSTFGELAHDGYGWVRETTVDWLGEPINVDLVVWGEEDEDIVLANTKRCLNRARALPED